MYELPPAIEERLGRLPQGLGDHIERTRRLARELAERHGVDTAAADLAAAAHDLARDLKGEALLDQARLLGLEVRPVEEKAPLLLHGSVAATWLEREGGIADQRTLNAVRWHSTGRRGFGPMEKVVFLADKLDPEKVRQNPGLQNLRKLAMENLDEAILGFLDQSLAHLLRRGRLIHPESIEFRNELLAGLSQE